MRHARAAAVGALVAICGCVVPALAPVLASAGTAGGVQAPSEPQAGGSEYGVLGRVARAPRPVISALRVPSSATAGRPPKVTLRLDEQGVGTVYLQVKVINLATHHSSVVATMGWSHTGRTLTVAWPAGAQLAAGSYVLSVSAHDHHGQTLLRKAHSSGEASLTVTAPVPVVPTPVTPTPTLTPALVGVPTPAQTVADGAVFPVVGEHNFGGPENRFGAPRAGYTHQGQDVLAAEGTQVVVPLAGTITSTSYQAGGAGYYAVEHTGVGFDFMFAHCEAGSLAVSAGQLVAAGQALCKAGQTGDATAPHLHFEMWVGGWQAPGAEPIDPLPYLQAWEAA
jgi:murein DD-endopeptidase MepM/ murein hydrolase activator NlpD